VVAPGRLDRGRRFRLVERKGFFTQDMLARLRRADRPEGVQRVGRGDVDGLDLRIGQQGLVRAVAPGDAELLPEPVGRFLRAAADRDQGAGL